MNQPNQPAPPFGYQPAFQQGPYPYPAGSYPMDITSPNSMPVVWPNAYYQQGVGVDDEDENILTKKIAGLPVWGWATIAAAGVGGWLLYKQMQPGGMLAKNDPDSGDAGPGGDPDDGDAVEANKSGWSPSRSGFGAKIDAFLKDHKVRGARVYIDADDAAKAGLKTPSPLITVRTQKSHPLHTDAAFVAMCHEDGLNPIETSDNIVGLYPRKSTKKLKRGEHDRGAAWEKYIDDLRDEGQQI
jgi:hypothetical protein